MDLSTCRLAGIVFPEGGLACHLRCVCPLRLAPQQLRGMYLIVSAARLKEEGQFDWDDGKVAVAGVGYGLHAGYSVWDFAHMAAWVDSKVVFY